MSDDSRKPDPADGDSYYANQLEGAAGKLCDLIRSMSPEELAEVKSDYGPDKPRWVSFNHEDKYFFECLNDEIERRKKTGDYEFFDLFSDPEARGIAYAYGEEDEYDWEVHCGNNPRVRVGWAKEIDATDEEIQAVAEGRINGFKLNPCQAEGCKHLVRRNPSYCGPYHLPKDPAGS